MNVTFIISRIKNHACVLLRETLKQLNQLRLLLRESDMLLR